MNRFVLVSVSVVVVVGRVRNRHLGLAGQRVDGLFLGAHRPPAATGSLVARLELEHEVPAIEVEAVPAGHIGLRLRVDIVPHALDDRGPQSSAVLEEGAVGDDKVGLTGSYCAVAETGTLVLLSGQNHHATTSLLPETHIAVVRRDRILKTMEEAWRLMRSEVGLLPRQVAFISGPSRTADIEMTLVYGAHGPFRVHVIVVDQ